MPHNWVDFFRPLGPRISREVARCADWRWRMLKSCVWQFNKKSLAPRTRVTTIACTESCSSAFAGLQEGERAGRPSQLSKSQLAAVGRDLGRGGRKAPVAPLGQGLRRGLGASSRSAVVPSVALRFAQTPLAY